ncbi:L,D-transpeptidase family protein [Rhodanobacter ginsengiterrae]|uniref:L,D-transpeptidase family protein n=1 Tax=Rhodanobacter ginsengiterrae TaxID=2008451 RepID=UPI003CF97A44
MIRFLALATLAASAQAAATATSAAFLPEAVNDATLVAPVRHGDKGAAVLRAQILLDRARFSPGELDAAYGSNLRQAIAGFQKAQGIPVSGEVDAATWTALDSDHAPALVTITLSAEDVAGPFKSLPSGMAAQSKLDALGYASPLEALGEKFHASPALLKQLNPDKDFGRAGEQLVVPSVEASAPMPAVARVMVSKAEATVSLLDEAGKVVAQYPASTGSKHDPLPLGDWKINGVGKNPVFHYNPKLFWDAKASDAKATLPAGPNNPVGVVWIDLSKDHYGIHGTPAPSKIGKTQSHGCIRMTNWDALEVSRAVKPGMTATLQK